MRFVHRSMTSAAALALAIGAGSAQAASTGVTTATGTEGAEVEGVVVTAEANAAAIAAPSKASILETQPQSIITHRWIDEATPESGDYTTVVLIAPSVAGVSANGGGVGDSNTVTLRGFEDGQYNLTFDGIAFGDANDTTHHPAAFFPSSTIGAAVVDRGPGAAGDLGQANFGGAIHLFSPTVSDSFGIIQKATYGSFNTQDYVTQIQTGAIRQLHDAKLFLNFDERSSDSELSYAGGIAFNQTAKLVIPVTDKLQVTGFASFNYTRYFQTDNGAGLGMGVAPAQEALYGKNFALNNDPNDEHYYGYNHVKKHTYFNYIDTKWAPLTSLTIEDQLYLYYYNNDTISPQAANDLVGDSVSSFATGTTDIGGYHKLNHYETFGDILRVNQDVGFGTLRVGGLAESSWARRFILNYDLQTGAPDTGFTGNGGNVSYYEPSRWFQYQLFADFEYRPSDSVTLTPGVKYINFKRTIDAPIEGSGLPARGSRDYDKTELYFTANWRVTPHWSFYGQAASGFLIPPVKTLAAVGGANASTQPQQTVTLQVGTVYTAGRITADVDYYHIAASNLLVNRQGTACQCYVNLGSADYSGVEGQAAYAFPIGLTTFVNGSINTAKDTNLGNGVAGGTLSNAPKATAAYGLIYNHGPWTATASEKWVGPQIGSDGATHLGPYDTLDASLSYDFGRFKLKVAAFNLEDRRARVDFDGTYTVYQVGRQVQGTVEAKF